jgi:hypothetical protein
MVSAVASNPSVLAPSPSKPQSKPSNAVTAFQQSVDQYLQDTTSGVGGNDSGGSGTNPSQTLSSNLMSSLLQMQQ